jgi:nucleoside-diphosphate-sugar epimerase
MFLLGKRESHFVLLLWATVLACSKDLWVTTFALASNTIPARRISIVTGGNGYVGREIIQVLLQQQPQQQQLDNPSSMSSQSQIRDDIYCLVRPSRVEEETAYWKSKSNHVRVMPYDMLDGGATISKALTAAHYRGTNSDGEEGEDDSTMTPSCVVYHVASVFGPSDNHIQTAKDNVKGTEDLVEAIATTKNTRLVLTSSMAAVRGSGQDPSNGQYYTHQDWNTLSSLEDNNWGSSYQWSKAESERRAWLLTKQHDIPMTSMCPSFVFGPPSSDGVMSNSYSIQLVRQWLRGESTVQSRLCVDIRDCAQAHVAAGTQPNAIGQRYIVSHEKRVPSNAMAQALQTVCHETGLGKPDAITFDATYSGGAIPIGSREAETLERLRRDLGITLRPVQET